MTTGIFIAGAQFSKSNTSRGEMKQTSEGQGSLNIGRIGREKMNISFTSKSLDSTRALSGYLDRTLSNAVSYEKPTYAREN